MKEQEEIFDDIDIEEVDDAQTEDGQLYEHFRIVADAGQEKLRIDKKTDSSMSISVSLLMQVRRS